MTQNTGADTPRLFGYRFRLRIPYVIWQNYHTSWWIRERFDPETKKNPWTFYIEML